MKSVFKEFGESAIILDAIKASIKAFVENSDLTKEQLATVLEKLRDVLDELADEVDDRQDDEEGDEFDEFEDEDASMDSTADDDGKKTASEGDEAAW